MVARVEVSVNTIEHGAVVMREYGAVIKREYGAVCRESVKCITTLPVFAESSSRTLMGCTACSPFTDPVGRRSPSASSRCGSRYFYLC